MSEEEDPMAQIRELFKVEAEEAMNLVEEALLALEEDPSDASHIDAAFRGLHTLKGSGAMTGYENLSGFAHHLENAFDQVRSGATAVTPDLIDVTLKGLDFMKSLVEADDLKEGLEGEDELLDRLEQLASASYEATEESSLDEAGEEPELEAQENEEFEVQDAEELVLDLGDHPPREDPASPPLSDALASADPATPTAVAKKEAEATEKPEVQDAEELVLDLGDHPPHEDPASPPPSDALASADPAKPTAVAKKEASPAKAARRKAEETIRVPSDRLDILVNLVGELVITQASLTEAASRRDMSRLSKLAEEIARLSTSMRDIAMDLRMLPIGSLFGKFKRVVRDLSRELDKDIQLVTNGAETELDKTVIDQLNDPLVHLIRNCADHGLEPPAERVLAGKPPHGTLRLSAEHSGANVVITVGDDGRGLNPEKIREKCVENGLLLESEEIIEHDLYMKIFEPGFSTASAVTSLSGRGVGMDVVKQTIEGLRGSVDIASTPGEGARVILRIPLTLAIIDGLLVRVGDKHFVLPLAQIEEVYDLSQAKMDTRTGRRILNIRDKIVPFILLRDLFGFSGAAPENPPVIIVRSDDRRVGLVVDKVVGQHQTVIKNLSRMYESIDSLSGATILGDGSIALILDLPHLVRAAEARERNSLDLATL